MFHVDNSNLSYNLNPLIRVFMEIFQDSFLHSDYGFEITRLRNLINNDKDKKICVNYCYVNYNLYKMNLLAISVLRNRFAMVKFLVEECNADLEHLVILSSYSYTVSSFNGFKKCTPLLIAVNNFVCGRNFEIIDYLIEKGANVNAANAFGLTPLMFSVNDKRICRVLVEKELVDVNKMDYRRMTAMDYAVQENHFESVSILLQNGVKSHDITNGGCLLSRIAYNLCFLNDIIDSKKIDIFLGIYETIGEGKKKCCQTMAYGLLAVSLISVDDKTNIITYLQQQQQQQQLLYFDYNDDDHDDNQFTKNNYRRKFFKIINYKKRPLAEEFFLPITNAIIKEITIIYKYNSACDNLFIKKVLELSTILYRNEKLPAISFNLLLYSLDNKDRIFSLEIMQCFIENFVHSNDDNIYHHYYCYEILKSVLQKLVNKEINQNDIIINNNIYYFEQFLYCLLDLLYFCYNYISEKRQKEIAVLLHQNKHNLLLSLSSLLHVIIENKNNFQFHKQVSLLKTLVFECKFDINYANVDNQTPLLLAVKKLKEIKIRKRRRIWMEEELKEENETLKIVRIIVTELDAHVDQRVCLNFSCTIHKNSFDTSCYDLIIYDDIPLQCCCHEEEYEEGDEEEDEEGEELRKLFNNCGMSLKCLTARFIKNRIRYYRKNILALHYPQLQNFINIH